MKLQKNLRFKWRLISVLGALLFLSACFRSDQDTIALRPKIIHKEKILIDPGHGGKDPGTLSDPLCTEKALNLMTAKLLQEQLQKLGYHATLTRSDDTFIPLKDRAEMANSKKADLFISVHFNHSKNHQAQGVEVFYFKEGPEKRMRASKMLAQQVIQRVIKHTGAQNRGVKQGNFAVIRETQMPAILIEGGFLSNEKERAKIENPQYRHFLTWAIACGIDAYIKGK